MSAVNALNLPGFLSLQARRARKESRGEKGTRPCHSSDVRLAPAILLLAACSRPVGHQRTCSTGQPELGRAGRREEAAGGGVPASVVCFCGDVWCGLCCEENETGSWIKAPRPLRRAASLRLFDFVTSLY